ncbi:hypothetical protein KTE58_23660 [Burkholderia multivorans]|uniref:hypothetical protein n=1 Tax=Burkholderia multivorans TaxID=87883 RepID=UPI001C26D247|nr:hypothetical protein [Burkholderia multivorans]MBU9539386.1 hypothetical protein [Burkholderia multivorans]
MKEPILSREEVIELLYACNLPAECEPAVVDFAERYEAALLEKLRGEPAAHIFPSDLERFKTSETFAQAYSVAVGNPEEHSVPLYALNRSKA